MLYFISIPYKILNIITNKSEKRITAGEIPREIYVVVCFFFVLFFSKSLQSKTQIHSNLHKCVFLCIFCQFLMEYIHI